MKEFSCQRGSAFFIILIAIALFAALSYAVSQGSRAGIGGLGNDRAKLAAQEIISYSNTVGTAFQKLRLKGCTENQISVSNTSEFYWTTYQNPDAPADLSCHIYELAGAGVTPIKAKTEWFSASNPSATPYWAYNPEENLRNLGTAAPELLFVLPGLDRNVCTQINNILGVGSSGSIPPIVNYYDKLGFNGTFPAAAGFTSAASIVDGSLAFCITDTDNIDKFVSVVLVR